MTLNHLNLTVTDPIATSAFLAKYFALRAGGGNGGMQVLYDDQGMVLTLIKGRPGDVKYPPTFHVGFIQPSEREVDAINARLREGGFDVDPPARMHGAWTFYFTAPGGFTVEVMS
jgi:catechol 2,3-dioxygenase-like lactoylglutathione lyase family enzyme